MSKDLEEQLIEQLSRAPLVEVLGIVSERSAAIVGSSNPYRCLLLHLHGWKTNGSDLETSELDLRKIGPDPELSRVFGVVKPYDVVRVRARVLKENVFGSPQGQLIEVTEVGAKDADLAAFSAELQKPVTFECAPFGVFTLNRSIDWFEATTEWMSNSVQITVPADAVNECVDTAAQLWVDQNGWQKRVMDFAVEDLLTVKNESWNDEGEPELTGDDFRSHMLLESISIPRRGEFEFWFGDGDMFLGHLIRVSGTLAEGPKYVGLEG